LIATLLKPDSATAHDGLGLTWQKKARIAEAIGEYSQAIRLKPDYAPAHLNLGGALIIQGLLAEAIEEYREAIRLQPNYTQAHCALGDALAQQEEFAGAIAEYHTAVQLEPDFAAAHNGLARAFGSATDPRWRNATEALRHARAAVALDPTSAETYNTLALAEFRSGHWKESVAASEKSMALRKGPDASDWFLQALAHWQNGAKDEARRWFDKAVGWTREQAPQSAELRQIWTEAAELLGQPGPGPLAAPSSDKPG
jgi:tetratricopeptide (TPR) repeat protein